MTDAEIAAYARIRMMFPSINVRVCTGMSHMAAGIQAQASVVVYQGNVRDQRGPEIQITPIKVTASRLIPKEEFVSGGLDRALADYGWRLRQELAKQVADTILGPEVGFDAKR